MQYAKRKAKKKMNNKKTNKKRKYIKRQSNSFISFGFVFL